MANTAKSRLISWLFSEATCTVLSIFVVSCVAHGLFYVPAIYSDDWSQGIGHTVTNDLPWLDLTNRRPLLYAPFLIQSRFFGLNVPAYYIVLGSLHVFLAILLYIIASQLSFMRRYSFSLIIALLFLVYPSCYAHMWLTMLHDYCAFLLTLIYGYFLLRFARGGHGLNLVLGLICLLTSFGLYEAQLGIACTWSSLLVLVFRQVTVKRRLGLLAPIVLAGFFMFWRTLGYQAVGINDNYLSQITLTPGVLLDRLLLGYKVSLGWGWTTTVQYFFPWLPGNKPTFLLLAGVTFAVWCLLSRLASRPDNQRQDAILLEWSLHQRWQTLRFFVFSSLLGLVFIGAGYIPVVALNLPNLHSTASRVNLFASPGSAVFVASALMIGSLLFAKNRKQVKYLFLASALPFILLGIVTQAQVQYHTRTAWREQQDIWQELFSIAPDFRDDTMVVSVLPGYQDRFGYQNWRRTPLYAWWEVSSAVRLLYDNPTLSADVIFPDIQGFNEPTLTPQGIVNRETGAVTPYAQSVFFVYDNGTGTLRQLDELPVKLVDGAVSPIKVGAERVLDEAVPTVPLRRLVED